MIGSMRCVAHSTVLFDRRMRRRPWRSLSVHTRIVVAFQANIAPSLIQEEFFLACVSPVAPGTASKIHRAVNIFIFLALIINRHIIVTLVT